MDPNGNFTYPEPDTRPLRAPNSLSNVYNPYDQDEQPTYAYASINFNPFYARPQYPMQESPFWTLSHGPDGTYVPANDQQFHVPHLGQPAINSFMAVPASASHTEGGHVASQSGVIQYGSDVGEDNSSRLSGGYPVHFHDCGLPIRQPGGPDGTYYCVCGGSGTSLVMRASDSDVDERSNAEDSDVDSDSSLNEPGTVNETERGGEREGLNETEDENPSQFEGAILPAIDGFSGSFASVVDARKLIGSARHQVEVEDDDVEAVKNELQDWAKKVHDAMRTLPDEAHDDNISMFNTISNKTFDPAYFEARAYDVIGRTIQLHEDGSELQAKVQLRNKTIEQCKASERLKRLVHAFLYNKSVVKDILDGWKISAIIAEPSVRQKCAKATTENNKRKKKVQEGIKAKLARMEAEELAGATAKSAPAGKGRSKGKHISKTAAKRATKLVEEEKSESEASEDKQVEVVVEDETIDDMQSDAEQSGEDEIIVKKGVKSKDAKSKGARSKSKNTASVPKSRATRSKNSKNVTKASDPGGAAGQAGSPGGEKRKHAGSGNDVAADYEDPPQGGRRLRQRCN